MRRLTLCLLLLLGVPAVSSVGIAQQDTSRARRGATTSASSGGEVARAVYNGPAVDTAIMRLERFLQQYPRSEARPRALMQLGELLVRRADERFAESQRSGNDTTARPDYREAIARYQELLSAYPNFERRDAVAYTLGTLYSQDERHADAVKVFSTVARDSSAFTSEALFRLGDSYFEIASTQRGAARRASFAKAASAYERAAQSARSRRPVRSSGD